MTLTVEEVREMFSYDPADGVLRWRLDRSPKARAGAPVGCIHRSGYLVTLIRRKNYQVHRLIWAFVYGCWPPEHVDHVNGVRSDNRLQNIRACSPSENGRNKGRQVNNTTGFKGVSFCSREGRYQTTCRVNGRKKWIGYFDTPEEASIAYEAFAKRHHGEFYRRGDNRPCAPK